MTTFEKLRIRSFLLVSETALLFYNVDFGFLDLSYSDHTPKKKLNEINSFLIFGLFKNFKTKIKTCFILQQHDIFNEIQTSSFSSSIRRSKHIITIITISVYNQIIISVKKKLYIRKKK